MPIYDTVVLGEQLKILSEAELDFSLETTGFEMGEIDMIIEGLSPAQKGIDDPADALPEPSSLHVSQRGDIWILGKHRILCGNALSRKHFELLMGAARANVAIADPPYNVRIFGHASGNGKTHHREFGMAAGEMDEAEFTKFLAKALGMLAAFSLNGSLHFVFIDWRHVKELLKAGDASFSELKNLCIWVKDNPGMGSFYRSGHELIFVFQNGTKSSRNNVQLGRFGRSRSNVWNYPGANSFSRSSNEGDLLALHPTPKCVAMVADAIKDCSSRGDLVVDPFVGSGTTIIAAERTGRVCYAMELDPGYVDTTVRRWQDFTGLSAIHANSGDKFAEVEKEVCDGPAKQR